MQITNRDFTFAVTVQFIIEICLFVYLYYRFIFTKNKNNHRTLLFKSLFYLYIIAVLFITILPLDFQYFDFNLSWVQTSNLFHPFEDLILERSGALKAICFNILMFMPLGFLFPIITKSSFIKTLIIIFISTLSIELIQVSLSLFSIGFRVFDITDIITNCTGGIIGYLIYRIIKIAYKKTTI